MSREIAQIERLMLDAEHLAERIADLADGARENASGKEKLHLAQAEHFARRAHRELGDWLARK